MIRSCREAKKCLGFKNKEGKVCDFFIGQRVRLLNKYTGADIGATGIITSIGIWYGGDTYLRITWDKDNPHYHGERDSMGDRDGKQALDFEPVAGSECIYCKSPIEYTGKYHVCTECFRIQE